MKYYPALLLAFLMILSLTGCQKTTENALDRWEAASQTTSTESSDPNITILRLTHSAGEESCTNRMALIFKDRLEQISGGKMQVEIYPNDTLGSLEEAVDSFSNGAVDIRIGTANNPCHSVLMWMPLLSDYSLEDFEDNMKEGKPLRTYFDQSAQQNNLTTLAVFPMQYRVLASKEPITDLKSFEKLNMRSIGVSGTDTIFWSSICGTVTPLNIQHLHLALQQDIVNACDNTILNLVEYGLTDQIHYITEIAYKSYFDVMYINTDIYESLTTDEQKWVSDAASYTETNGSPIMEEAMISAENKLRNAKVEFSTLSAGTDRRIREQNADIVKECMLNQNYDDILQEILSLLGQNGDGGVFVPS